MFFLKMTMTRDNEAILKEVSNIHHSIVGQNWYLCHPQAQAFEIYKTS